ncbi:MAG: hypothetical protein K8T10_21995 [Candidatus Eremiobacteraeota bacterium]|nr:hypothetical protein [Candidatus Eremiobacteraeota bacterium]
MTVQKAKSNKKAASSGMTAQEVIDMFAELGLPVCDDGDAVEKAVKKQRRRRLREKHSPDPHISHLAGIWFKNLEKMKNDRPELIPIVYERFCGLASVALEGATINKMTPELAKRLLNFAYQECRVDDKLASRFLDDYMREKGIKRGKPLVHPAPVTEFTANSGKGEISLSWKLPGKKCDEIEIEREEVFPEAGKHAGGKSSLSKIDVTTLGQLHRIKVYNGRRTSWLDKDVNSGTQYRYRIHSIFSGCKGVDTVDNAVCIGEVENRNARWKEGSICLDWKLPSDDVSVLIFRRKGSSPSIGTGAEGLEPTDGSTQNVYWGVSDSWKDSSELTEGATYYYKIVQDFGKGVYSNGVTVSVGVPKPPPPVPYVTASYSPGKNKDQVSLKWGPAPGNVNVEYVVVRRDGSDPPGRVEEGIKILKTPQTDHLDENVVSGQRYTYAVFTRSGEIYSRRGTASSQVDILTEVRDLEAEGGDGTVELHWEIPENVTRMNIQRSLGPPKDHMDGHLVTTTGKGYAKDEGLANSRRYHYLVSCVYRPDGTTDVFSPGSRTQAIPDQPPDMAGDFTVQAHGQEVLCKWSPPGHGKAVVIRSANPHGHPPGYHLKKEELDLLGERIITENDQALDTHPDREKPYYSIFTVAGSNAVAGGKGCCIVCPDVTGLKLTATSEGVSLRWTWPDVCTSVVIARRLNTWPEGPNDPQATRFVCAITEYKTAGDKFLDAIQQERGMYHYIVYAKCSGLSGGFFSPGQEMGCRKAVQWGPWMIIQYKLSSPRERSHRDKDVLLNWNVEKPFPDFSGFALVANDQRIPSSITDGIEIFRWKPGEGEVAGEHEDWINIEPIQKERWARFFAKLIVIDPIQADATLIIHPNICETISDKGVLQTFVEYKIERGMWHKFIGLFKKKIKGRYCSGVPDTIICPTCFREFPICEMKFTSYGSGEDPIPGKHTLIHKILRKPPEPPVINGKKRTKKLCPESADHVLPITAGTHGSLIIGLIGAKFSGKTHYIASLVNRLEGQVGRDLEAALNSVTEITQDRYRDDFKPLFETLLPRGVTIGTPPPLIYDLTIDGKLWGENSVRSVTLALYETAGENFNDPKAVRQMIEYLKVASGVMFLIDPLQSKEVRNRITDQTSSPEFYEEASPNEVISRVLTELQNGGIISHGGKLSIPIACVFTKCDVLRDSGLIEPNRLWSTDTRHIGYFNIEAHNDMAGMMGEYIQRLIPAAYNTVRQRFSRHAFFGVSATGCAPNKKTGRFDFISPWRVEDPLLWLLYELGVIQGR